LQIGYITVGIVFKICTKVVLAVVEYFRQELRSENRNALV
jgi:hypothetical protein